MLLAEATTPKPSQVSFVQAAALPVAGGTAWDALEKFGVAEGEALVPYDRGDIVEQMRQLLPGGSITSRTPTVMTTRRPSSGTSLKIYLEPLPSYPNDVICHCTRRG